MQRRAGVYVRVSTRDQSTEGQTLALRQYCERRELEIARVYSDDGVSGRKGSRPELDALLADARARRIDVVVVTKLDRLARSLLNLTTMAAEFEALGVDLIVTEQSLDSTTPSGRLMFGVLGSIAEFETTLISDRTRAGLAAARSRGVRLGRRPVLNCKSLRRVKRLRGSGHSIRDIACLLEVSVGTIHAAVKA